MLAYTLLLSAAALMAVAAPASSPAKAVANPLTLDARDQECNGEVCTQPGGSYSAAGCTNPFFPYCVCAVTEQGGWQKDVTYYLCSNTPEWQFLG